MIASADGTRILLSLSSFQLNDAIHESKSANILLWFLLNFIVTMQQNLETVAEDDVGALGIGSSQPDSTTGGSAASTSSQLDEEAMGRMVESVAPA